MRQEIYDLNEKHNVSEGMTIRQAVEWWKDTLAISPFTGEEGEYINKEWGWIMTVIATRESLPVSWLSYLVAELAYQEWQLLQTAIAEGAIALSAGETDEQTQEADPLPSIPGTSSSVG